MLLRVIEARYLVMYINYFISFLKQMLRIKKLIKQRHRYYHSSCRDRDFIIGYMKRNSATILECIVHAIKSRSELKQNHTTRMWKTKDNNGKRASK